MKQLTELRSQLTDLRTSSAAAASHVEQQPARVDQRLDELSNAVAVRDKEVETTSELFTLELSNE